MRDILIATLRPVSDHTIREVVYQFDMVMKIIKPDVGSRIRQRKVICVLVAKDDLTSDLPQFKSDKTGRGLDFYSWRQHGFLTALDGRSTGLFAEKDVVEYDGGDTCRSRASSSMSSVMSSTARGSMKISIASSPKLSRRGTVGNGEGKGVPDS